MANVFKDLDNQKNLVSRNGFDGSRRDVFSLPVGIAVPVYSRTTLPNGEYECNIRQLLRTEPIIGAPFTRLKIQYEWFYYDNNHAYSSFNEFIAQREDPVTSVSPTHLSVPRIHSFNTFLYMVLWHAVYDMMIDTVITSSERVVGFESRSSSDLVDELRHYYFPYCAYASSTPHRSMFCDILRTLDLLRYGNYLPLAKHIVSVLFIYLKNAYSDYDSSTPRGKITYIARAYNTNDVVDEVYISSSNTLSEQPRFAVTFLSMFWMCITGKSYTTIPRRSPTNKIDVWQMLVDLTDFNTVDHSVNLWSVFAYNKYWYTTKRNQYYDDEYVVNFNDKVAPTIDSFTVTNKSSVKYVDLFNGDDISGAISSFTLRQNGAWNGALNTIQNSLTHIWSSLRVYALFALKPIPYHRDMYNSFLPSTQFGDVSIMRDANDWRSLLFRASSYDSNVSEEVGIHGSLDSEEDRNVFFDTVSVSGLFADSLLNNNKFGVKFDPAIAISVLEERRANAIQRFTERMLRAGNKTSKNFLAHWGVVPSSVNDYDCVFLGAQDGEINLNTVAATTGSGDSQELAQLGSNGVALVTNDTIHFKSSGIGTLMCVAYISKPCEYDNFGVSRQNQILDVWDYPYPELQNISLAPMDLLTINKFQLGLQSDRIVGYQPRFIEHKTDVDFIHGEFFSSIPNFQFALNDNVVGENLRGVFAAMTTPKFDMTDVESLSWLYVDSASCDNIFTKQTTCWQSSDNFFVNCMFDVKLVQPLSIIGLPQ